MITALSNTDLFNASCNDDWSANSVIGGCSVRKCLYCQSSESYVPPITHAPSHRAVCSFLSPESAFTPKDEAIAQTYFVIISAVLLIAEWYGAGEAYGFVRIVYVVYIAVCVFVWWMVSAGMLSDAIGVLTNAWLGLIGFLNQVFRIVLVVYHFGATIVMWVHRIGNSLHGAVFFAAILIVIVWMLAESDGRESQSRSPRNLAAAKANEKTYYDQRRQHLAIPDTDLKTGLAFSGGGVRSAAFAIGALRAFQQRRVLHTIDYLSSVSGGGYTASAFMSEMHHLQSDRLTDDVPKRAAFLEEAVRNVDRQMCSHAGYMIDWHSRTYCGSCECCCPVRDCCRVQWHVCRRTCLTCWWPFQIIILVGVLLLAAITNLLLLGLHMTVLGDAFATAFYDYVRVRSFPSTQDAARDIEDGGVMLTFVEEERITDQLYLDVYAIPEHIWYKSLHFYWMVGSMLVLFIAGLTCRVSTLR